MVDSGFHTYITTLVGNLISKGFKKNQTIKCLAVVISKGIVDQVILEIMFFSRDDPKTRPLLEYAEGMAKAGIGLVRADEKETGKVTLCHWEMPRGPFAGPDIKFKLTISGLQQRDSLGEQLKSTTLAMAIDGTAIQVIAASVDKTQKKPGNKHFDKLL